MFSLCLQTSVRARSEDAFKKKTSKHVENLTFKE